MSAYISRMTYENMTEAHFKCKYFLLNLLNFLKCGMHQYLVGTLGCFKWHFTVPLEECSICYCVPFSDSYLKLFVSFGM